jgi:hypothetical protein
MQTFCEQLFAECTKEKWQNCCSHVKQTKEEYWQRDGVVDEAIESVVIHLGES